MSYTEIRQEGGMPYGGMPHDALLYKLEETDPELVREVRGDDPFFDMETYHKDYVRAEIIDRTPDDVYLESDHPRRDPALPRSILNLRYSGGRGPNDYRLPQHPELFLGFTGNDPRGRDTQPRLDKVRAHTIARARNKEVRMGHNVGHGGFIEADRPWGGMAAEYDKKEMQRRLKSYYQWFPAEKVGRPWGRNVATDEFYNLRQRGDMIRHGDEGLYVPEQDQPGVSGPISRGWIQQSTYAPVRGAEGGAVRRVDRAPNADTALWRNIIGDTDLAVQKYSATPGGGRETFGASAHGGERAAMARSDQTFGAQTSAKRRGRSAPELARDIAIAARWGRPDQSFRPQGQIQAHEGGRMGPSRGLGAPPENRQAPLYKSRQMHLEPSNVRLTNAEAIVRSLRQGTPAQLRAVQGQGVAAGKMGTATSGRETGRHGLPGGGLVPSVDYNATFRATETPLQRAAAAAALEVHNYGRRSQGDPMVAVEAAQVGGFESARRMRNGRREGMSQGPSYHGQTQMPVALGDRPGHTFGSVGEHAGPHTGGLSLGEKDIRMTMLPDGGDDVLSRYVDFDGLKDKEYSSPMGIRA